LGIGRSDATAVSLRRRLASVEAPLRGCAGEDDQRMTPSGPRWSVVIPLKGLDHAKSRLVTRLTGGSGDVTPRGRWALAMALDTLDAAARCDAITTVFVVTADDRVAQATTEGRVLLVDDPGGGLDTAINAGCAAAVAAFDSAAVAAEYRHIAVLVGDLPALRADDLATALVRCAMVARAVVSDRTGSGTTMLTARQGQLPEPHFGPESRRRHIESGATDVSDSVADSLRCDVDTAEDLEVAAALGLGRRTSALLDRRRQPG
jgi:2-phospho-L-lactate guanylyltransferase